MVTATTIAVPTRTRVVAGEQLLIAAGQIQAGAGNFLFALVMARLLAPAAFAHLAVFLGLFMLVGLPTTSLSAIGALAPNRPGRLDVLLRRAGLGLAGALAVLSPWLARLLGLPVGVIIALAAAAPVIAPLGLQRGRLLGARRHVQLLGSLVAEPAVRLTVGVLLALVLGTTGAALGVAAASLVALHVARTPQPGMFRAGPAELAERSGLWWTATAFVLLAVVQTQDLVLANRLLDGHEAARFAALSTLGGMAAYATLTVPLVLLPRAAAGQRDALRVAVGVAATIGALVVVGAEVSRHVLTRSLFGGRYESIAPLVVPYLAAMALLGITRVLVAHRCARGKPLGAAVAVAAVAFGQAWMIVHGDPSAPAVATATLSSTGTAAAVLGGMELIRESWWRARVDALITAVTTPTAVAVAGLTAVGLAIRVVVPRGLWLDEATSVFQARMGFGAMLENLRTTDVHPPLYFAMLWSTVRVFGSGEMAVRLPSILAGLALIPVLYLCGAELYDRRTGLVAAAFGSVSPLLVWYSQEARMYALYMVLAVAAVWLQARAVRRGASLDWLLYALVTAALVWTQYFALLQVAVQQAAFLVIVVRRWRRPAFDRSLLFGWLGSGLLIASTLVLLLPFALQQFSVNQQAGRGFIGIAQAGAGASRIGDRPSVYVLGANLVWAGWGYHSDRVMSALVALWPVLMFLGLLALGRRRRPPTTLLLAACVVPVATLFAIGMAKRDLFDVRYFAGATALGVLLLARLVTGTTRTRIGGAALSALLVASLGLALSDQQTNGSNPRRYSFREATRMLNHKGRDGDSVLYAPADLGSVLGYYDRGRYRLRPLSPELARDSSRGHLYVLVSPRLLHAGEAKVVGRVLADLRQKRRLVGVVRFDNVQIWELA